MSKKYCILVGAILFLGTGCSFHFASKSAAPQNDPTKINITASIYPIAYFAEQVGGKLVTVHQITPNGVEPHDYAPTPGDIATIESSKAFLYNGAGIDAWADHLAPELSKKQIQVLGMANYLKSDIKKLPAPALAIPEAANANDPHIWLDPILAQKEVEKIVQLFDALDPEHQDVYEKNAADYLNNTLLPVDKLYRNGLANCTLKEIISSHNAFNYLARRYGFTVNSIAGVSPEDEPSAARLGELTRLVKAKNIHTIFFESLVTPKLAQTLSQETGATTSVLDPIEGITSDAEHAGKTYDILMRENLEALKKAMLCQ